MVLGSLVIVCGLVQPLRKQRGSQRVSMPFYLVTLFLRMFQNVEKAVCVKVFVSVIYLKKKKKK